MELFRHKEIKKIWREKEAFLQKITMPTVKKEGANDVLGLFLI